MNLRGDWRTQEELEGKRRNRNDVNIVLTCRISKRKTMPPTNKMYCRKL